MKKRRKKKHGKRRAILLIAAVLLVYSFVEPYRLEVKEYTVESEDIPASFDGVKLAFISDLHYGKLVNGERIEQVVEKTNALEPDIVLLGGDYITGDESLLDGVFSILGGLKPEYGTFSVIGNHEWPYDKHYKRVAVENNITPVDDRISRVFIGKESVVIAGSEFYLSKQPDLRKLEKGASDEDFVVFLQHNPDYAEVVNTDKIDLMLSGHNHGGQVTLFGKFAPFLATKTGQKYRSGMVENMKFPVIVSNGTGVYRIPMRLGARPQIVLVKLKAK